MPFQNYTLTNIQDMLQDRYEDVAFWTSVEATDAINEALLMWNLLTGTWTSSISITTVADQQEYDLTSALVFGTRVEYNGASLAKSYQGDMDNGRPGWRGQATDDGGSVPTAVKKWIPLGLKKIMIWPADHAGGNTLTVDGVAATPQLSAGGDFIDVGNELINALVGYALHAITLKEGGARFNATLPMYIDFLTQAAAENVELRTVFERTVWADLQRQQHPVK